MIFLDYKHHCQQFVELGGKNQEKMGEGGGAYEWKTIIFFGSYFKKVSFSFQTNHCTAEDVRLVSNKRNGWTEPKFYLEPNSNMTQPKLKIHRQKQKQKNLLF